MDLSPQITAVPSKNVKTSDSGVAVSGTVTALSLLIALLALIAAGAGLWERTASPTTVLDRYGETVILFGSGLYRHDALMTGAGFLGQDTVTLFLGIPLLLTATYLYRRQSLRGALLLFGTLGYFLYLYVSMAFGAAFNPLFLLYVALFSLSLFAFVLTFVSLDRGALAARLRSHLPWRGAAIFMVAGGVVTTVVWGGFVLAAQLGGTVPDLLLGNTTAVTYAFDLATITPGCFLVAALFWQRRPLAVPLAMPLLVLIIMLLPGIILMTVFQMEAGVVFTLPELIGAIGGFTILGLFALWVLAAILRNIKGV